MDARQFDALTRSLTVTSRRGTLVAFLGGLVATLLTVGVSEGTKRGHRRRHPQKRGRGHDYLGAEKKKKHKKRKCKVKCGTKVCGPSNCKGKSCGACPAGERCNSSGQCVCDRQCGGKDCGPDACGGECGQCTGASLCNASGKCVGCLSADDCANGQVCTAQQVCCTPSCDGRHCAGDGCGGTCDCAEGTTCDNGQCVCPTPGQVLCGGACSDGECCAPNEQPGIQCGQVCLDGVTCCPNGQGCTESEQCCGFDREQPADRAICQDNQCCQPLGAICGGQSTTCCQGTCKQGTCDACEPGACCTNHAPGCPVGQKCCGTTCIDRAVCCTDGVPDSCPAPTLCNASGECVQCLSEADCPASSACVTWSCRGDGVCVSSLADNGTSCGGSNKCRDGECVPKPTCGVRLDPCTTNEQCCSGVCLPGGIGGTGPRTCQAPAIGDPCPNTFDCFPNICEAYLCVPQV